MKTSILKQLLERFDSLNVHLRVLTLMIVACTAGLFVVATTVALVVLSTLVGGAVIKGIVAFSAVYVILYIILK